MDRSDRRRYFRINDIVGLSYRLIERGEVEAQKQAENVQIAAAEVLRSIDRELTNALNAMWQSNPTAANAIGLLNKKMDVLAAEMDLDYAQIKGLEMQTKQVSISACGIAFECRDSFHVGQSLKLDILLKPANTHIQMMGNVLGCDQTENGHFLLRVDFDSVDASVQEQLIQHIVRRQSSQLGSARKEE